MAHSKALAKFGSDQELVANLDEALKEMPRNMLLFSTFMRSLYVDNAVGTKAQAAVKFRKLRDDTKNDAMIYLKHVLPLCTELVSALQDFFEYYSHLSFEQWCENLPEIVEDVHGYKQLCEAVVKMHEDIMTSLKKREDQAKLVLMELKDLQAEYERQQRELEASASTKNAWFVGLLFIPVVNLVACPLLKSMVESDNAKATASGAQADTQAQAAYVVATGLMPAIQKFLEGLKHAAGFFQIMESELGQFARRGKQSIDKDRPVKAHYIIMKEKANTIIADCRGFMFALPSVRSDFEAIPSEGTDQNYIDRWLEKQLKIIEQTCTVRNISNKIMSVVSAVGRKVGDKALTYK